MYIDLVGTTVWKNSKQGGIKYTVIGHLNCDRCSTLIELREVEIPSKEQRKRGQYYAEYSWCYKCGLYTPKLSSKTIIK